MKRNTKLVIADTFIEMVASDSLSHIRIADLIEKIKINRNTFYYHFSSKSDVAMWVFRKDLAAELRSSFSKNELISSKLDGDEKDCPYYVHIEIGAHMLDFSGFLKALIRCTYQRSEFYQKLFTPRELEFTTCLTNLFYPAIQNDIEFILDGRYMPEPTRHMLCSLCTRYLITTTEFCLGNQSEEDLLDDRINPFWNIVQESLHEAIQAHPINRYTRRITDGYTASK